MIVLRVHPTIRLVESYHDVETKNNDPSGTTQIASVLDDLSEITTTEVMAHSVRSVKRARTSDIVSCAHQVAVAGHWFRFEVHSRACFLPVLGSHGLDAPSTLEAEAIRWWFRFASAANCFGSSQYFFVSQAAAGGWNQLANYSTCMIAPGL
jgi:hypothetical protein